MERRSLDFGEIGVRISYRGETVDFIASDSFNPVSEAIAVAKKVWGENYKAAHARLFECSNSHSAREYCRFYIGEKERRYEQRKVI